MRKVLVVVAMAAVVMALVAGSTPAGAGGGKGNKVEVCHRSGGPGNPTFKLISVSANALPAHLGHGDAQPGDPVPGSIGMAFDASCTEVEEDGLTVFSQNLYIGADLSRIIDGEPPAALLPTIQQTDFPSRALKIAEAIAANDPDLIGLQEVTFLSLFDASGNVILELDYLQILLGALAAEGESYAVSSTVDNADVTLPIDPVGGLFARVLDRDVILHRTDTTTVSNPVSANYGTNFTVDLGGFPLEFTRGYTAVDASVDGLDVHFVNTHLEVENAPCVTPTGVVICQDVQSEELIASLAGETLPVVLVGDLNAEPGMAAYDTVDNAGYTDSWTIRANDPAAAGLTCCQSETLENPVSQFSQRIDHVFIADGDITNLYTESVVLGDSEDSKTPSGLWYSDHGGPLAEIRFQPASP